jgi:hypothetical protein
MTTSKSVNVKARSRSQEFLSFGFDMSALVVIVVRLRFVFAASVLGFKADFQSRSPCVRFIALSGSNSQEGNCQKLSKTTVQVFWFPGVFRGMSVCARSSHEPPGSVGFQTCCVADFQVGSKQEVAPQRVWKPATRQTWKSALRSSAGQGFKAQIRSVRTDASLICIRNLVPRG